MPTRGLFYRLCLILSQMTHAIHAGVSVTGVRLRKQEVEVEVGGVEEGVETIWREEVGGVGAFKLPLKAPKVEQH